MQDQENQEAIPPSEETISTSAPVENSLEAQLSATEAKLAEMHDAFMRAKAEGENIRRRGHVGFHMLHGGSRLQRQPAAVVADPLADDAEMFPRSALRAIFQLNEARRVGAASPDHNQAVHALFGNARFIPNFAAQAVLNGLSVTEYLEGDETRAREAYETFLQLLRLGLESSSATS